MFEGKIIDFYNSCGDYRKVKVVSCIKDVGITIIKENDPNHFCYCLKMKLAPNFIKSKGSISQGRKIFTQVRKMIISGTVDLRKVNGHKVSFTKASSSTCAFNQ